MAFGGDSEQTKLLMLKIEAILGDDADALDRNAAGSMMRAAVTMLLRSIINKTAAMLLQRMDTEPPSTRHNRQRQGGISTANRTHDGDEANRPPNTHPVSSLRAIACTSLNRFSLQALPLSLCAAPA